MFFIKRNPGLLALPALVIAFLLIALLASFGLMGGSYRLRIPVRRDLPQIQARDTLRVIAQSHPLTFYLFRGTRLGFDYELLRIFAQEQNLVLEMVTPRRWGDMIPLLYKGEGDIIASMMTVTDSRREQVDFTRPYLEVRQVAVGTDEQPPPMTLDELRGRSVLVRKGSSYEERIRQLRDEGINIWIDYHNELDELDDPVQFVARGRYPLTIVDDTIARLEQHFYPGLQIGVAVSEPQQIAWAVRPNSPELLAALNDFLERHDRDVSYNVLKQRYFESPKRFLRHRGAQLAMNRKGRISRYDRYFHEAARETGFDWRFLAAVSYHESRFFPNKVSWAGAVGLMQLMPRTGRSLGVRNLYNARENILAGSNYMRHLYDLYSQASTEEDRISITLAAYNAGIGHLADARRIVRDKGRNPYRWADVREALLLLERPEHYTNTEHGFTRAREAIQYVNDVLYRYELFIDNAPEEPIDDKSTKLAAAYNPAERFYNYR